MGSCSEVMVLSCMAQCRELAEFNCTCFQVGIQQISLNIANFLWCPRIELWSILPREIRKKILQISAHVPRVSKLICGKNTLLSVHGCGGMYVPRLYWKNRFDQALRRLRIESWRSYAFYEFTPLSKLMSGSSLSLSFYAKSWLFIYLMMQIQYAYGKRGLMKVIQKLPQSTHDNALFTH